MGEVPGQSRAAKPSRSVGPVHQHLSRPPSLLATGHFFMVYRGCDEPLQEPGRGTGCVEEPRRMDPRHGQSGDPGRGRYRLPGRRPNVETNTLASARHRGGSIGRARTSAIGRKSGPVKFTGPQRRHPFEPVPCGRSLVRPPTNSKTESIEPSWQRRTDQQHHLPPTSPVQKGSIFPRSPALTI